MIKELDHGDFYVKDRQGLVLLFMALRLGLNAQGYYIENFPIELFYRQWANSEAQVRINIFNYKIYVNHDFVFFILDVSDSTYITKF